MVNYIGKYVRFGKAAVVACSLLLAMVLFTKCINDSVPPAVTNNNGEAFAGSEKCKDCHNDIYESFITTAHNITSQPPSLKTIKGSFEEQKNVFAYSYYDQLLMQQTDSGLYQVHYHNNSETERRRMDMIIGSGVRGQSFAGWHNNKLYQLPGSFFTSSNVWVNSPGYRQFTPDFSRVITTRCLECHVSFLKETSTAQFVNQPDQSQIIYGVQCERCHGAAAEHVVYHETNPDAKKAMHITTLKNLDRVQSIDLCTYCHGGMRKDDKTAFNYVIGDTIQRTVHTQSIDTANFDVHGNLYDMLSISECFKKSETMECITCHNPHQNQRTNMQVFSSHCMSCHSESKGNFCTIHNVSADLLKTNCIDCHMPVKKSKTLTVTAEGDLNANKPAMLRSHYIGIYPKESEEFLSAEGW